MRRLLADQLPGYLHGGAWKLLALACKFVFLIRVAPSLPEGHFADFLFWQSAALLVARALSCGVVDQLPILIRGRESEAVRFRVLIRALQLGACIVVGLALLTGSVLLTSAAMVAVLVTGGLFEGTVRSVSPRVYEHALNWPWIVFLILVLTVGAETALGTLQLYVLALLSAQLICSLHMRAWPIDGQTPLLPAAEMRVALAGGAPKMLSDLSLLANMRALVVLPPLLLGDTLSDETSYALAIADALSGLLMAVVNRNYVRYCTTPVRPKLAGMTALLIMLVMCAIGAAGMAVLHLWPSIAPMPVPPAVLLWACLLFGAVVAYQDLRYYHWASGVGAKASIYGQVAMLAVLGIVIVAVPALHWLPATAVIATCLTMILAMVTAGQDRRGDIA